MSYFRRLVASLLCPDLMTESDRLFRMRADMSDKIRWLGHDYPMVEVVLSRLLIDDLNWSREFAAKPMVQEYPYLGGVWPPEMYSFREKMRATFGTFPTPRPDDAVGGSRHD